MKIWAKTISLDQLNGNEREQDTAIVDNNRKAFEIKIIKFSFHTLIQIGITKKVKTCYLSKFLCKQQFKTNYFYFQQ